MTPNHDFSLSDRFYSLQKNQKITLGRLAWGPQRSKTRQTLGPALRSQCLNPFVRALSPGPRAPAACASPCPRPPGAPAPAASAPGDSLGSRARNRSVLLHFVCKRATRFWSFCLGCFGFWVWGHPVFWSFFSLDVRVCVICSFVSVCFFFFSCSCLICFLVGRKWYVSGEWQGNQKGMFPGGIPSFPAEHQQETGKGDTEKIICPDSFIYLLEPGIQTTTN